MCCRVTAGRPLAGPLRWRPAGCQQVDSPARVVACDRTGSATLPQWVRIQPWLGQGAPTGPPRVRVGGAPTLLHPRDSLRVLSGREKRGGQVGRWRGRWQFVTVSLLSLVIAVRPPHPPPRPSPSALSFSGNRGGFSRRVSRGGDTGGEEIQTVRRYRRWRGHQTRCPPIGRRRQSPSRRGGHADGGGGVHPPPRGYHWRDHQFRRQGLGQGERRRRHVATSLTCPFAPPAAAVRASLSLLGRPSGAAPVTAVPAVPHRRGPSRSTPSGAPRPRRQRARRGLGHAAAARAAPLVHVF